MSGLFDEILARDFETTVKGMGSSLVTVWNADASQVELITAKVADTDMPVETKGLDVVGSSLQVTFILNEFEDVFGKRPTNGWSVVINGDSTVYRMKAVMVDTSMGLILVNLGE